jgi:DNA-binding SARP family transcriptional activator
MIRLSMLGAVDLRGSEGDELRTMLAQPKRLALLAYLAAATPHAFHSRDKLLSLLWPELNQERARAALRQALHVLRRELGDGVLVTCGDEVIGLNHGRLWCDVIAFDHAIDAGDRAAALALYGGELLAGFHVPGAAELERWLEGERARLAGRAAAAARVLVDAAERRGDLTSAVEWARWLLAVSPDDERALRRVVALLHILGDRAGALRVYREFARRIAADYDLEPAPETQALISAIRSPVPRSVRREPPDL